MKSDPFILVISTAANFREARTLSRAVLNSRAAACVNLSQNVESAYWWKGKIEKTREVVLWIKTRKSSYKTLEKLIKKHHSYSVPEIIAVPILHGNPDYLAWIKQETR